MSTIKPRPRYYLGIDPGTDTGLAVYDRVEKKLVVVQSSGIISAMDIVRHWQEAHRDDLQVIIEDARKKTWFGSKAERNKRAQGAGSVRRDAAIWQEFVERHGIKAEFKGAANGMTKWKADLFNRRTGWTGKTNNHGRDAAALVYGK